MIYRLTTKPADNDWRLDHYLAKETPFPEKGHPLLGDTFYGGAMIHHRKSYQRQCLHSHRLVFLHPVTKERMVFTIPPPGDILP